MGQDPLLRLASIGPGLLAAALKLSALQPPSETAPRPAALQLPLTGALDLYPRASEAPGEGLEWPGLSLAHPQREESIPR